MTYRPLFLRTGLDVSTTSAGGLLPLVGGSIVVTTALSNSFSAVFQAAMVITATGDAPRRATGHRCLRYIAPHPSEQP